MALQPNSYALLSMKIVTEEELIENGYIIIKEGKITDFGPINEYTNDNNLPQIHLSEELYAAPGFIDLHIHGLNGSDVMDASTDCIKNMAKTLPKEGTTSFLATTITQEKSELGRALQNVNSFIPCQNQSDVGSEVLGVHLEGPFINEKRAGAQPPAFILEPSVETFRHFQSESGNHIKLVTLAPEEKNGLELVKHLSDTGVIASIGHSDALYAEVVKAIEAGAEHITHFFNGMRGSHHREPGVAGAGLAHPELFLEMIVDGIHVHPAMVKATFLAKGVDHILLITDSMRAKWLDDGEYELGGQKVIVENNTALLEDGTLAGSVLKMNDAVRNMKQFTDCTMQEAIQMATANPAKRLHVWDRKGSISIGKDADIVILDEEMQVKMTFCKGILSYKGE
ncbi:N-acetylglucosamine-6-phosphate deacetylase [Sutcliffiella horikoshii]|uniref:N-acetylglucosamine-6-phosphate deacetylase n=1 Tax=Sutcliffiella horikoshii TaxID=79883 RepID=A0AA94WRE4_9BACI|nr:N-acetylglucosamine-6-phosphate deacetylase [Sutcliffiella horikoshii]TYS61379.1 N-acetylglucosamine-6-phosphate deacetylase [Sutcliffiella horikoshii]